MSAISGTFVKIEPVSTRKVVRLHIECPIEEADKILKTLGGYPDPANPKWVGIAQLDLKPQEAKGGKLAQKAGILCAEVGFRRFLAERNGNRLPLSEDEAKNAIYMICGVSSRAYLDHDDAAGRAFHELDVEYRNWLNVVAA